MKLVQVRILMVFVLLVEGVGCISFGEKQALLDFESSTNISSRYSEWKNLALYNEVCPPLWGIDCDEGHITSFHLRDEKIYGTLPDTFGNLVYLEYLYCQCRLSTHFFQNFIEKLSVWNHSKFHRQYDIIDLLVCSSVFF